MLEVSEGCVDGLLRIGNRILQEQVATVEINCDDEGHAQQHGEMKGNCLQFILVVKSLQGLPFFF